MGTRFAQNRIEAPVSSMAAFDIQRLIAPRTIALIGAGVWTDAVAAGNAAVGYRGSIWRVHPSRPSTAATTYYRSVAELPGSPDAAFLAVPNHEAPAVAGELAARGAGGFVCFSSGFSELGTDSGRQLTQALLDNAGRLPFFGPNCYGFVNFFDRAALLPDQVVGAHVERGVAFICQSGTIALTLSFNERSVPIGYLFSVGNQTRLAVEDLIEILCEDPRVTAFGLYLEGIKDADRFARAADIARAAGKPIAVVKSGRTAAAARTAHSHTGALAGADSVFEAFCRQAGLARCDTLGTLCRDGQAISHGRRPPRPQGAGDGRIGRRHGHDDRRGASPRSRICADSGRPAHSLRELLTLAVTVANPFDIHTYLWFDPPALGRVFATVLRAGFDAVGFMLDFPPEAKSDTAAFDAAIDVFIEAARERRHARPDCLAAGDACERGSASSCLGGGVDSLAGSARSARSARIRRRCRQDLALRENPQLQLPAEVLPQRTIAYVRSAKTRPKRLSRNSACRSVGEHQRACASGGVGSFLARISGRHQSDRRPPRAQDRGRRRRAQCAQRRRGRCGRCSPGGPIGHAARRSR